MTTATGDDTSQRPLRLWPGVVAAVLLALSWFVVPFLKPEWILYGMLGAAVGIVIIAVWWLFFSRARWFERLAAIVLMALGFFVTSRLVHRSIANGMMGMMFMVYALPVLSLALVCWAVATRRFSNGLRRALLVVTILLACGGFTLIRTGGISGEAHSDLHWRWTKTPEERLLARAGDEPATPTTPLVSSAGVEWPGFRGPERDGILHGTRIKTDWTASPPVEQWRQPIGPGWSSFAVSGDVFYTQEQRGDDEVVTCYNLTSGKPVWRHRDAARFWESNAGAGPRGTPTISNGRVYTFGATGILNALDARNGSVIWSRNAATDTQTKVPGWGFASSPLVVGEVVVVATAGSLAAYNALTGSPLWFGPKGNGGYSSPHLMTIAGVPQVVLLNGEGATSVAPSDGTALWKFAWSADGILQPALTEDGDLLIGSGSGMAQVGLVRFTVSHDTSGWSTKERWKSFELNPYYNDFVVHKGHVFGFEGSELACIDLKDGSLKWKGGRYGHGQLVLLSDQDLLLVESETGELSLVKATADELTEVARFKAINGKTWNHPVLVKDILLVRNSEEMAAFRVSLVN
jgi:outer membrane protein assembly factor BamB